MAKKKKQKRGRSSAEKYKQGIRERKELEAFEASLSRLQCATFLKTNTKLMIPSEGIAVHKRSLWKDGKYLGLIHRLLCDESVVGLLDVPKGRWGAHMPESEYEFLYQSREELENQRAGT